MEIQIKKADALLETCDVLIVSAFQSKNMITGFIKEIDDTMSGLVGQILKEEQFTGKANQILWIRTNGLLGAKRILLVGLGKKEELTLETIRQATAASFSAVKSTTAKFIATILHSAHAHDFDVREITHTMTEGVRLASYTFGRYKKEKNEVIRTFSFLVPDGRDLLAAKKGFDTGKLYASATMQARDLVNTPGLHMSPSDLVFAAKSICKGKKQIRFRVFDQAKLERMNAGGIIGVAKGSDHPPFLVHMTYVPNKKTKKRIALVGKGVTFDSGGISIKPADYMMTMKCDMAGAADVIGVFSVLAELAPNVEVHGIFAAVENMPSGSAIRPGDVLTMMNKKTVEVLNTDAEGRLILADALVYANRLKPNSIIDLATLTGACVVALGEEITGVMSNNPQLANQILSSAANSGEKMWELPLEKNYQKLIVGDIADLKNIGGRWGGALTAGLFLQEFVDKKTPWAHLDIAGPAFAEHDIDPYTKKGATGHGVRTLLRWLQTF